MLSVPADRPLAPEAIEILSLVHAVAYAKHILHFVIGATARDILFEHVFNVGVSRATRDVDFAIAVADWQEFQQLKDDLLTTGRLTPSRDIAHRLYFEKDRLGKNYPVDLIPFGDVEQQAGKIAWPPDMEVVMSVAGYPEAMAAALPVDIGQGLTVHVVSLPGLAALKLLAWADRGLDDSKDATDLGFILANYCDAGNHHRLYEEAFELMEVVQYDLKLAGAALLGRDTRQMLRPATLAKIKTILADTKLRDRLEVHMHLHDRGDNYSAAVYLAQFEKGLG